MKNNNTLQGWADIIMNNKDTVEAPGAFKDAAIKALGAVTLDQVKQESDG